MSAGTSIEWTDRTWNPVRGCVKVSAGCKHCYAETFAERWRGLKGHAYEQGFDLRLVPEKLDEPLRWRKPARIFVNSMSDLFQEGVPDEFVCDVLARTYKAPQHIYQVLTKRPARMRDLMLAVAEINRRGTSLERGRYPFPPPNLWLGVSVEDQATAEERIPLLLETPAAVRFVSAEPLLGPVDLSGAVWPLCIATREEHDRDHDGGYFCDERRVDWVIVGGESGPGARPCDVAWIRAILAQCREAQVPAFCKQLGSVPVDRTPREDATPELAESIAREGVWKKLRARKGGDPSEWPEDLRVREFPEARG